MGWVRRERQFELVRNTAVGLRKTTVAGRVSVLNRAKMGDGIRDTQLERQFVRSGYATGVSDAVGERADGAGDSAVSPPQRDGRTGGCGWSACDCDNCGVFQRWQPNR